MVDDFTAAPVCVPRELYRGGAPRRLFAEAARFFRRRIGPAVDDWPAGLTERWMFGSRLPLEEAWSLALTDDGPVGFCLGRELGSGLEALLCYLSGRFNTAANAAELLAAVGRGRTFILAGETALSPAVPELAHELPRCGWERFPRLELLYDFDEQPPPPRAAPSGDYTVERLRPADLDKLALLQAACYLGTDDARLHTRLAEPVGSQRVLEEVLGGRYGEPVRSGCLLARSGTGATAAFILTTAVSDARDRRLGFIASVGVGPAHRGRGLGRRLVDEVLRACRHAELAGAALVVSATNHSGRALYRGAGFRQSGQTALYRRDTTAT